MVALSSTAQTDYQLECQLLLRLCLLKTRFSGVQSGIDVALFQIYCSCVTRFPSALPSLLVATLFPTPTAHSVLRSASRANVSQCAWRRWIWTTSSPTGCSQCSSSTVCSARGTCSSTTTRSGRVLAHCSTGTVAETFLSEAHLTPAAMSRREDRSALV